MGIKIVDGPRLEEEACRWVVEVPNNFTLAAIHRHIIQTIYFHGTHMAAFFTARDIYMRKMVWLAEKEEGANRHLTLDEIYPLHAGHRLFYIYDPRDRWIFSIGKRKKIKAPAPGVEYPQVISEKGPLPVQYLEDLE